MDKFQQRSSYILELKCQSLATWKIGWSSSTINNICDIIIIIAVLLLLGVHMVQMVPRARNQAEHA
jgi:hypothetical protein